MKSCFKLAAVALFASATLASADTEIRITGSTAFRSAVHASLLSGVFSSLERYSHSGTSGGLSGASKATFRGTVTGITGTTTIRTSWSGSATGIQSVAAQSNVSFLTDATFATVAGENFSQTTSANQTAHIAMSDVFQNSTSFQTPVLEDTNVAVVPFVWVVNNSANAENNKLTSITSQQARALYTTGSQALSLFTGVAADTRTVYVTGRDTGSGTRITALAETKYGFSTPLTHYQITASGGAVTELRIWPTNAVVPSNGGDTLGGNGGYTSGGTVATALSNSSSSGITIRNAAGTSIYTNQSAILVTCIGLSDSATIAAAAVPGKRLAYEGTSFSTIAADGDKVRNGSYTMWGYQHLFNKSGLTTDETTARDALITAIPTNLGTAGISLDSMIVGRGEDGGLVSP